MVRIATVVVLVALLTACGDDASSAADADRARYEATTTAPGPDGVRRVDGADVYTLAANLAVEKYHRTSDPILASGEDPADALAGSYLAGLHASPVLLTGRDALPAATLDALRRINAHTVHVLGGTASISDAVVQTLTQSGFTPNRIAGAHRFATASAAAREENSAIVGSWPGEGRTALLANGFRPVDALTAGTLAYGLQLPILLTDTTTIPTTSATLDALEIAHVMVLGGTAAVSDGVVRAIEATGRTVRRVAGADRAATAVEIATLLEDELGYDTDARVVLAGAASTGVITAAGPYAAPSAPILLCLAAESCGDATLGGARAHHDHEVVVADTVGHVSDAAADEVRGR